MSTPANTAPGDDYEFTPPSPEEMHSALFAQLVMQQANMAALMLGKTPHPQTGRTVRDLEAAQLFIDQLEMLEVKTRGNLTKEEEALLKQNLMALRLAFVEAAETPAPAGSTASEPKHAPEATATPPEKGAPPPPNIEDEESRKRFSKKY